MVGQLKYLKVLIAFISFSGFAQFAEINWLEKSKSLSITNQSSYNSLVVNTLNDGPDTSKLVLPGLTNKKKTTFELDKPDVIKTNKVFDSTANTFTNQTTLGDSNIIDESSPQEIDEYLNQSNKDFQENYFKDRALATNFTSNTKSLLNFNIGEKSIEDIFGSDFVDIKPQGSVELMFMYDINRVENPSWSVKQQRNSQFKFEPKMKINVLGKIGDKINLNFNFDTEANFDFDNQMKLNYEGKDDDIIQLIEAGNVSLPVQGSLINGSQNLFGLKTKLKFGRLSVTSVISKQNTERKEVTVEGGSQKTPFNIPADQYDANRHYFLSQYFRNQYNDWAANSPLVMTPLNITRVEVWVTNQTGRPQETRNIISFMDMGEHSNRDDGEANGYYDPTGKANPVFRYNNNSFEGPDNDANTLYAVLKANNNFRDIAKVSQALENLSNQDRDFEKDQDYVKIDNARLLSSTEYTVHDRLGFISLNSPLNADEVLAVSFEYTLNGQRHQVGEFSRDVPPDPLNPKILYLKMLRPQQLRTDLPTWDLMMKNVYSLNTGRIESEDFRLDVIYADDESGADLTYIPEPNEKKLNGKQLIKVLGLDKVNRQNQAQPDGVFDFIDGLTVNVDNGKVFFPVLEPFGDYLYEQFDNKELAEDYVYQSLYDSIPASAIQQAYFNKFFLSGYFKGTSGSEISLNAFNIQQGSVKVTAGGTELVENQDYTVDYTLGRVRIINEAYLSSGQQIKVSHESSSVFGQKNKALYGTRLDYRISDDLNFGGTLLYLREKPITQKVNVGDEPLQNTIWGLDGSYRTDSRFLTKLINKLPLIQTKEKSEILVQGEFAHLIPGNPKVIGDEGTSYIDDFEGSEIPYDLRLGILNWNLASTPQGQNNLFPNATSTTNDIRNGFNRAKLAWYILDPLFYRNNSYTPNHIKQDVEQLSNHYVREVIQTEVFPQRQVSTGTIPTLSTLDLAYYPNERGPYNYDYNSIAEDGTLLNPKANWAGIQRGIETNNFEAANIEYIEFWMLDPFIYNTETDGGEFLINLGQVSEDVLSDGRKSYENGLPSDNSDNNTIYTSWGRVPIIPNINNAFDVESVSRVYQDVGIDGLGDAQERAFYDSVFLEQIAQRYGRNSLAYINAQADPSADNYSYFRGSELDSREASILERYKNFNGLEGNSPTPNSNGNWPEGFSTSSKITADDEDINRDFTLNTTEAYFQYKVELSPDKMVVGQNYITDVREARRELVNGKEETVKWYQFKVPIRSYEKRVGNIVDFKTIRFMRLILRDFDEAVICRFAQLQLVRADWRRYLFDLGQPGETVTTDPYSNTVFDVSTVNLEENSLREPIKYVLPPGITREIDNFAVNQVQQNEQSLSLSVCNLEDGDARSVFKNTTFDMRQFKKINMFVHAEGADLQDDDLTIFMRLGTDLSGHYYEYELPLKITNYGEADDELIWPIENEIALQLQEFYTTKLSRDSAGHPLTQPFQRFDSEGRGVVRVLGNPDLSNVRIIMIGIRNPKKSSNVFNGNDDGLAKCAEIWVNELRLTEFDKNDGWAANARVSGKLADFGQFSISGARKTIGFGGVEQPFLERSQDDITSYNLQTQFALDKFFPERYGIKVPFHFDYSQMFIRPRFNPIQPDVLLDATLESMTKDDKAELLSKVQTVETRRSINFINVSKRKTNVEKNLYPWSIENFSFTYKFTEVIKSDIFTVFDSTRTYLGELNYTYNFPNKPINPFKKLSKKKSLRLITDFNLNLLPASWSFQGQLNRKYNTILFRNNDNIESIIPPNYDKTFSFNRNYTYRHNLTKSLRVNYNANAQSIIDEPTGPLSTVEKRDSVWQNIQQLGRPNSFAQTLNVNYSLPIDKLPMLDFISVATDYKGGFAWQAAYPAADSLGNTITNSGNYGVNTQFNLITLYNKSQFLRTINAGRSNIDRIRKEREKKQKIKEAEQKAKSGVDVGGTAGKEEDAEEEEEEEDDLVNETFFKIMEGSARVLMSVRNFNVNYSINDGTILPGFLPEPDLFGNNFDANAPGWEFVFGSQKDIRETAGQKGWITAEPGLQNFYSTTHTENLSGNALIEPVKGFRLNIDFNRRYALNMQQNYRNTGTIDSIFFDGIGTIETGNYSTSFLTLRTAFIKPVTVSDTTTELDYHPLVEQFEDNRFIISERLAKEKGGEVIDDSTGYYKGFGSFSQEVLIPAFLAAYTGKDAKDVKLSPFWDLPLPNWRISYNGLSQIKAFKKWFRTVNISHSYKSTYQVSNFVSALDYETDRNLDPSLKPNGENYLPQYQIQQVSISEQFSPLFGIDITWKNKWTTGFDYQKSRTLAFTFSNFQLQEQSQKSYIIKLGYRTKGLILPFKMKGKKWILENDFNFRTDISIRENRQILWNLDEDVDKTPNPNDIEEDLNNTIAGNRMVNIAPTVDYNINKNLNIRIFYTRNVNIPFVTLSFPRKNTQFGFSLRYTLTQ